MVHVSRCLDMYNARRMARRLLLISTSTVFGTEYLEHALPELGSLAGVRVRASSSPTRSGIGTQPTRPGRGPR